MDEKHIRNKAITGMTGFLMVLWLLLFLPAFSLGFWEAWIYWILFSLSVILITLHFLKVDPKLMESRLDAGPGAEGERSQKIIQGFTALMFFFLLVIPGFDNRFGWSDIPVYAVAIGDLITVIGFAIVFMTFRENTYTSATIEVSKDQPVISTGVYALIRHPMYAGASLLLIATPFALGSFWALFPAVAVIAGIILRLREEEKFLAEHLPGYREYCLKIRFRLIPFIW